MISNDKWYDISPDCSLIGTNTHTHNPILKSQLCVNYWVQIRETRVLILTDLIFSHLKTKLRNISLDITQDKHKILFSKRLLAEFAKEKKTKLTIIFKCCE